MSKRPANPADISFAAHCFAVVGETVYWTVTRSALHDGPARFDDRAHADAYAAKCGRPVQEHRSPKLARVSWT